MDLDHPVPTVLAEIDFSEFQASGKYVCSVCSYVYDPAEHDGLAFDDLARRLEVPSLQTSQGQIQQGIARRV